MTKQEAIDVFNKIWRECACSYPREMSSIVNWLNNLLSEVDLWSYTEISGVVAKGEKVCSNSGTRFEFVDYRVWNNYEGDYVEKGLSITVSSKMLILKRHYSDGSCETCNMVYHNQYGNVVYMCDFCTENPDGKDIGRTYHWTIYPNDKQQKFHSWDIRDSATRDSISGGYWDYDREEYVRD